MLIKTLLYSYWS